MISQNKRKAIRLLEQKKRRDTESLFVAEGRKVVGDLLRGGMRATYIAATPERIAELGHLTAGVETVEATTDEIAEVSALQTRSEIIAIFRKPSAPVPQPGGGNLIIALDGIQDPGNMGTIIRTADWFGVTDIVCSTACADAFGPKTVQATMGALARVRVSYTDLAKWLLANSESASPVPVYGTYLEGDNIYKVSLASSGIILMGNEGHGIDPKLSGFVSRKLFIPSFPAGRQTSESLNVGTATAITLSEFRRPR